MTDDVMTETTNGPLRYRLPADLPAGVTWLGVTEDGGPLQVRTWSPAQDDQAARAEHVHVIGRTGSGTSATLRALLGRDLVAGHEVLIPLDGGGTMSPELSRFSVTAGLARTPQKWAAAIAVAHAVLTARVARLCTGEAWSGPTLTDPIITLLVDGSEEVAKGLHLRETVMVNEIARTGRPCGVRVIQVSRTLLTGPHDVIGGTHGFCAHTTIMLAHAVDPAPHHDQTPAALQLRNATHDADVSLPELRTGQVVVVADGTAVRGQVAWLDEQTLDAAAITAATGVPQLRERDLTADVQQALDVWHDSWRQNTIDLDQQDDAANAQPTHPAINEGPEQVVRVVFGDEIGQGTTVLKPCRGPRLCTVDAGRHRESASYNTPDQDFHRLTLKRLRRNHGQLTAVVADQDGVEQPWESWKSTPLRVLAATLPGAESLTVPEPTPEWTGIPADPRWHPYRLRMAGPRWWRPWWTAHIEYLGAWVTNGDQKIITVRSWSRSCAFIEATDALVDRCQSLTEGPHTDRDLIPVVWLGAHLVTVTHLAAQKPGDGDQ